MLGLAGQVSAKRNREAETADRAGKHRAVAGPTGRIHINVEQGTDEWLKLRRVITASSAAAKAGLGTYKRADDEWLQVTQGIRLDTTRPMALGHLMEPYVADSALRMLFPYPEKMCRRHGEIAPLGLVGIYLLEDSSDWLSASPDRKLRCHPLHCALRKIFLECKFSEVCFYDQPSVEYIIQCQVQMYHGGAKRGDFMFIAMGYRLRSTAVFLIEYCPELIKWLKARWARFRDAVKRGVRPTDADIVNMGHEVKDLWAGKRVRADFYKEHTTARTDPDFFPPQPRWQLVCFEADPLDEGSRGYGESVTRESPAGPVSPETFYDAIGRIWERIAVSVSYEEGALAHSSNASSLLDDVEIGLLAGQISELEQPFMIRLLDGMWYISAEQRNHERRYPEGVLLDALKEVEDGTLEGLCRLMPYVTRFVGATSPSTWADFVGLLSFNPFSDNE